MDFSLSVACLWCLLLLFLDKSLGKRQSVTVPHAICVGNAINLFSHRVHWWKLLKKPFNLSHVLGVNISPLNGTGLGEGEWRKLGAN